MKRAHDKEIKELKIYYEQQFSSIKVQLEGERNRYSLLNEEHMKCPQERLTLELDISKLRSQIEELERWRREHVCSTGAVAQDVYRRDFEEEEQLEVVGLKEVTEIERKIETVTDARVEINSSLSRFQAP